MLWEAKNSPNISQKKKELPPKELESQKMSHKNIKSIPEPLLRMSKKLFYKLQAFNATFFAQESTFRYTFQAHLGY